MSVDLQVDVLGVARVSATGKSPVQASPVNRICEGDNCETVLSRYNHSSFCTLCMRVKRNQEYGLKP